MKKTIHFVFYTMASIILISLPHGAFADDMFTTEFYLQNCNFLSQGRNLFFSIEPGYKLVFQGEDDGEPIDLEITVLNETKDFTLNINGVTKTITTRVVEEREWEDGELAEVSRNYFAICRETNSIYYFGEDVDIYDDGMIESHEGAWLAGQGNAQPGLIMPGTFLLGSKYYQEVAPNVALDQAEHTEMGLTVTTPAGTFNDCVKVKETTPLEPDDLSEKIYCPGVGLVVDDTVELTQIVDNRADKTAPMDPCAATYDITDNIFHVPCLDYGSQSFWVDLEIVGFQKPVTFELDGIGKN